MFASQAPTAHETDAARALLQAQETLRQYKAELDLQNQELVATQAETLATLGRFQALFAGLPMPALVLDGHGLIQQANDAAMAFFGFKYPRQVHNHSVYRLLAHAGDTRLAQALSEVGTGQRPVLTDWLLKDASGAMRHMEAHISLLPPAYHLDAHRLLWLLDRSAQAEHDQMVRVFQSILDNADALIYAFDREGQCILANAKLASTLHRPLEQLVGHSREEWMQAGDAKAHIATDHQVFATQRLISTEEQLHVAGKPLRYFTTQKFPLKDPSGRVFAVGGITTEITKQRAAEQQLRWAMAVFNRGSEGVVICDNHSNVVMVNSAFERITGYTHEDVVGRNPSMLASGRHDKAFYRQFWQTLLAHGHWEGEIWNRRKAGEVYPQWLRVSRVSGDSVLPVSFVGVFSDLSSRKASEEEIERLAFYDLLTNTPNRHLLKERLEQTLRVSTRESATFAVLFLDLDHFKEINDTHGHDVGDEVLIEVSHRLQAVLRAQDTVCRQGGDEFIVLLNPMDQPGAQYCALKLLNALIQPVHTRHGDIQLSGSIGISMFPEDGRTAQTLLRNADSAMYQAKQEGRNGYRFFSDELAQRAAYRAAVERSLREALDSTELALHYQPKVNLHNGCMLGAEALLRWKSQTLGIMPPDVFIPIAEESGLIVPLGTWVLKQAVTQIKAWHGKGMGWISVSVNVSAGQFWKLDLPKLVAELLSEHGVPPHVLDLELTERIAMINPDEGVRICQRLKEIGVTLSMDDFGTGYSSLAYLSRLPMDVLKIDQSFVKRLGDSTSDEQIVRSVIQLAHSLSLHTVAEGVETATQLAFLKKLDCDQGQGYLFSRPLAPANFENWAANHAVANRTPNL